MSAVNPPALESHHVAATHWARMGLIAITANVMQGEAQRCRDQGMDDYLSKPLRMTELAAVLNKWLPVAAPLG